MPVAEICLSVAKPGIHRRALRALKGSVFGAATLFATQAMAIDVANQADWNTAVAAVAAAGAGSTVTINFTGSFTLASSLSTLQAGNANVTVNITGNNQAINGAATFQGIQVSGTNAPTVNISNLAVTNTAAIGGAGVAGNAGYYNASLAYGAGGGGGGGLGAGGGLFVGSGANVTLTSVTFTGNSATGGAGGAGGSAQNVNPSGTGGNGGDGGAMNNGGAAGGGGAGGSGGNTGTQGTAGTAGATGAGGGGGGGSGTLNSNFYTINNNGGTGGTGAGTGGRGGDGVTNNQGSQGPGADGGYGGAGGSAQGGAIYVANGGMLTILDTGISGASATGGTGGAAGVGQGPSSFNGTNGATGQAAGSGLFLNGVTANVGVSAGTLTYANTIGGSGATSGGVTTTLNKTGAGTLVLSGVNTFTGNVNIGGGTLSVASQAQLGSGTKNVVMSNGTTLAITSTSTFSALVGYQLAGTSTIDVASGASATLAGDIVNGASSGKLVKTGAGTLILTPSSVAPHGNTYTGGTSITGGTLRLGSATAFATTGPTFVGAGATFDLNGFNQTFSSLAGDGTVSGGNTAIGAGGTFAPGNGTPGTKMVIGGNLSFGAGSTYQIQVNPATSTSADVTGTATLTGASVSATYANGTYINKQYTIVNATGGVSGTFSSLTDTNLPANFKSNLSYDANKAYLNLVLDFVPPVAPPTTPTTPAYGNGLTANQNAVANTLINYFNTTGSIPLVFGTLTAAGLTQVSGETATGTQQSTFNAMNQFMGVMIDPFIAGRGDPVGSGGNPNAYADEGLAYAGKRKPADALAAIYTKAPPAAPTFVQRWSVWAAGFGGSQTTSGDPAILGSNSTRSSIFGTAVGADYRISPSTIAGFALAGGGTNFSVNNFGSGRSDLFQAGGFIRHNWGPAYISGALAYGWQDVTTDRVVTVAGIDRLRAQFNANAWSGRVEGGYRFVSQGFGWTPYAAGQFTTYELPSYAETAIVGANTFALAYAARSVTDSRSELGLRTDKSFAVQDGILTLRGRGAWAHDYNRDRLVGATFQALPGAAFVVNGARRAADAALVTGSAEMKWLSGWSIAGTFEGEFSNVTDSYAGKGVVRYSW